MTPRDGNGSGSVETSIVIRAFNEAKHLPGLFDSLEAQSYRSYETIVVDSGSNDGTRDIAEQRADRLIGISSHDFTFGYSLNRGIQAARGKYVAIISAHAVPCDDAWLETLIAPLRDQDLAMTYGRQLGAASSKFGEAQDFDRVFGPRPRFETNRDLRVNNANSAIRRDLWQQEPFDERLTGLEDIAWARSWMEKGHRVAYVPEASIFHIHEESWRQVQTRYYREAVAARHMGLKTRRSAYREVCRESLFAAADLSRLIVSNANPALKRLTRMRCAREILQFRLHKTLGSVRGLMRANAMETRQELEDVLFDRAAKAVVIHGPGKASLESLPLPEVKPGDVLVQVSHVAVCATDVEILEGRLGYYKNGLASYPIVPGHEFSGNIIAHGHNVTGLNRHDRVVVECIQGCGTCGRCRSGDQIGCAQRSEMGVIGRNGAYADYVVTPARFVHKVPAGMDQRAAALTEPLAVVLKGLRRLSATYQFQNGPIRCGVVGAGPLGRLCAKVLAHRGLTVTAFDRNEKRLALFAGTGIDTSDDLEDLAGCNIIIEVTGDPQVLETAMRHSPANSAFLLLGLPYGDRKFSFESIAAYDRTIVGSVGSAKQDFKEALALLPQLDMSEYMECTMPLSAFSEAWALSKSGDVLKVILDVN